MRFLDENGAKLGAARFERIGGAVQAGGAFGHTEGIPRGLRCLRALHGLRDRGRISQRHRGHRRGRDRGEVRRTRRAASQIDPARIHARSAIQLRRRRQRGGIAQLQGRGEQIDHRDRRIGQLMHEGGIGAVFEQTPHQVGEQIAMRADRRIDAAGDRRVGQHFAIHALAHAVQALHLERRAGGVREFEHGGDGARVVRSELRIDVRRGREQAPRTREIRQIGVMLVGEDRIAVEPEFLRALDLGVPIRALDQPHHQAHAMLARKRRHGIDDLGRARLVGLHREAEAAPMRMRARDVREQGFEDIERKLQSLAFFGIDGQVDARLRAEVDQAHQARQEHLEHLRALRFFIARMQGRELDRHTIGRFWRRGPHAAGHALDRRAIRFEIALGIGLGACAFAEHVVRKAQIGLGLARRCGFALRIGNGLAEHELPAEQLNGAHRGRNHGLRAQALEQTGLAAIGRQQFFRQRDRIGRQGRDPGMFASLEVEGRAAELVGGQRDRSLGIGHPQQGLGQPHQGQAFGFGNRIFLEQGFHGPERRRMAAHFANPGRGTRNDALPIEGRGDFVEQALHDGGFVAHRQGQARRQRGQGGSGGSVHGPPERAD